MAGIMDQIRAKMANAADSIAASQGRNPSDMYRRRKRRQWTRQIIKTTRFDQLDWKEVRDDKTIDAGITDLYLGDLKNPEDRPGYLNAPELVQDIFMTFLKMVPMLYRKVEVIKDARLNGKFIEQMMALPEWERLHDQTATDVMMSKMATELVLDALKEMIKQHREQVKQANEQREQHDNDPNGDEEGGDGESWDEESGGGKGKGKGKKGGRGQAGSSPGHNKDEGGKSQLDEAGETGEWPEGDDDDDEPEPEPEDWDYHDLEHPLDQAEKPEKPEGEGGEGEEGEDEEATLDDADRKFDKDYADEEYEEESDWEKMIEGVDFGRHINNALKHAADQMDELDTMRKGVGLEDAEWKMMDPTARMKIAERLNTPRMKAIADMVGRMKRFAVSQQAQKIIDAPHEIFTVEMGNDLRRILRSEFAFLGHPATKIEFYRKYVNGELLQYKERGHEDVGKGPIIICIDNSGSMSGAPENWAKGVAEALRRICQDQGRDFHVIYFETNRHRERFDFPLGRGPFEKIMTFLGISAGGGTEFDGVLTEALNKVQTMFDNEKKGKADIVFVTDGEAFLDEKWIKQFVEERDRVGCRIFGVYISAYDSTRSAATKLLNQFCNVVIPVKALEVNDEAAATIFSQV